MSSPKVDAQEELNRVPHWIWTPTYTNIEWSLYLSPTITRPFTNTVHILSHTIYIFPLYLLMLSSRFANACEIVSFLGTIS